MAGKFAVLVRERQEEALRVALGLTLNDDRVEVFVLDRALARTPKIAANLEMLRELGMRLATTCAANADLELLSDEQLAADLLACDAVVPY